MIVGDSYDENNNQTTLTIFPDGNILLPGKWTKTSFNHSSKQHFFKNNDSITVAVAKNKKENYPFYKPAQSDKDFLAEFTKWESEYFKSQGAAIHLLDDQAEKGYVLWKATIEKENINTIYLFGLKTGYAYNLLADSKTWADEKTKAFLIKLFNDN